MNGRPPVVHVRMGQVALGESPAILQATLGSCVGIALLWRQRARYALAHCLLPYAPRPDLAAGGRYVDLALRSMLQMLQVEARQHLQLEAHIGGGANMRRQDRPGGGQPGVGALNVAVAQRLLGELRIPLVSREVGGFQARQMLLDCAGPQVRVVAVPPPQWPGAGQA